MRRPSLRSINGSRVCEEDLMQKFVGEWFEKQTIGPGEYEDCVFLDCNDTSTTLNSVNCSFRYCVFVRSEGRPRDEVVADIARVRSEIQKMKGE
jgi:hypothetical protein